MTSLLRTQTASVGRFLKHQWTEWRSTILFVVFVLVPVKSSLADWNWVPSGSMNPTILEGDLIYVNKLAYDLRVPLTFQRLLKWDDPKKGDIVVFFSPEDGMRIVKRVVATPGDTIEMRNRILFLNGRQVEYDPLPTEDREGLETALAERAVFARENLDGVRHAVMAIPGFPGAATSFAPVTVPEGSYFIIGDNRDNSADSRSYGFVARDRIVGRATRVLGSFNILDKFQPRFGRFMEPVK